MKPIDVKDNICLNIDKEGNDNDPKFKVGDHAIRLYSKLFLRSFCVKEIKNTVPWTYVINDLNGEEIIGTFHEKVLQKIDQQEFRIEKVISEKVINYMSSGKDMIVHLIVGLIKKT